MSSRLSRLLKNMLKLFIVISY